MNNKPIKLYTVRETADILGVHFRTIYTYIEKKQIKAIKMNGRWRISEEAINEYLGSLESNIG